MRRPWHTRLSRKKYIYIYIYSKRSVLVIIREYTLQTVTTLSFYTHIFQYVAFSSQEVLKAVIRNTDVLIFIFVDYRKYIGKYLVFTNSIARTYFNQSQCNFRILNPCRRLSALLGPASDKQRIIYIYIYIYIYLAIRFSQT